MVMVRHDVSLYLLFDVLYARIAGLAGKFVASGRYYVTLVAVNQAGLSSTVRSDVIAVVDVTPPQVSSLVYILNATSYVRFGCYN